MSLTQLLPEEHTAENSYPGLCHSSGVKYEFQRENALSAISSADVEHTSLGHYGHAPARTPCHKLDINTVLQE